MRRTVEGAFLEKGNVHKTLKVVLSELFQTEMKAISNLTYALVYARGGLFFLSTAVKPKSNSSYLDIYNNTEKCDEPITLQSKSL